MIKISENDKILKRQVSEIKTGDRIAQVIITPYITCNTVVVEELDDTVRGAGGFGSTGTN